MHINHNGTKTLETNRLILKKDDFKDCKILWDKLLSDYDAVKKCRWKKFNSYEDYINSFKHNVPDNVYFWTIWVKENNTPIGGISIHNQDDAKGICKVGYSIHPNYWGKGYATEALHSVLDFMINVIGYKKVIAECSTSNIGSKKVMEKNDMYYDGTFKEAGENFFIFSKSK